jgi:hypothetical protein
MVAVHGIEEVLAGLQTAGEEGLGERQRTLKDPTAAEPGEQLRIAVGGSAPEFDVSYLTRFKWIGKLTEWRSYLISGARGGTLLPKLLM